MPPALVRLAAALGVRELALRSIMVSRCLVNTVQRLNMGWVKQTFAAKLLMLPWPMRYQLLAPHWRPGHNAVCAHAHIGLQALVGFTIMSLLLIHCATYYSRTSTSAIIHVMT